MSSRTATEIAADMRENNTRKPTIYASSMLTSQAYRPTREDNAYLARAADLFRELAETDAPQEVSLPVRSAYGAREVIGYVTFTR